ncbi:putative permease, DMT superfamily [Burkholderiales bacterium JOSHI_001]|nr:putative permease, DMT superfamily [Burkholderiales bacterium JOSHI_001]
MTRTRANLLLTLVALIWGSAFVAQSLAMKHVQAMGFTAVRFAIGALVVAPLAWREWRHHRARGLNFNAADAGAVALLGLALCAGAALQQVGIIHTTVTNAAFLTALYVPLVPLLGWWWLGRRPHLAVWPAGAGCVAGTWLLAGGGGLAFSSGDLWVLASVLPWAVHVLFVGRVADRLAAPFLLACGQFAVCALASGAWALATETLSPAAYAEAAWAIAYTGIVSVGIGFTAQVVGQRSAPAADAAIIMSAETVFAAGFGYALMGERLGATGWAGCALILACIVAVQLLPVSDASRAAAPVH